jgi:DNA-binding CsgD family transcriptional regulator
MHLNRSDLFTQIDSLIQRISLADPNSTINLPILDSPGNGSSFSRKNHEPIFNKTEITHLKERIRNLEELNDHLLYYIYFLFQKLINFNSENLNGDRTAKNGAVKLNNTSASHDLKLNKPLLTKREMEIFNLMAKGLCAKEIAKALFISETTVITHKKNLKTKFNAKNSVELISNLLDNRGG